MKKKLVSLKLRFAELEDKADYSIDEDFKNAVWEQINVHIKKIGISEQTKKEREPTGTLT